MNSELFIYDHNHETFISVYGIYIYYYTTYIYTYIHTYKCKYSYRCGYRVLLRGWKNLGAKRPEKFLPPPELLRGTRGDGEDRFSNNLDLFCNIEPKIGHF